MGSSIIRLCLCGVNRNELHFYTSVSLSLLSCGIVSGKDKTLCIKIHIYGMIVIIYMAK